MSTSQLELLLRLIAADRDYRSRRAAGLAVHPDERGVEIGYINAVDPRTARCLVAAGLAEAVSTGINGGRWLFLGRYEPLDTVDGRAVPGN